MASKTPDSATVTPKKRKILSIKQKYEILQDYNKGLSRIQLQAKYGIKRSTVHDLIKSREKILNSMKKLENTDKGMYLYRERKLSLENLDTAVFKWYTEQRAEGVLVRGVDIQDAAHQLAEHLGHTGFKCSDGWLWRFRRRHGIVNNDITETAAPGTSVNNSETSTMRVQWKSAAEFSLVKKVHDAPALWDACHTDYNKKSLKRELYTKIAEELQAAFPDLEGLETDDVMNKFNIMKSSYRRELAKIKQIKSCTGEDYIPKWKMFESLSFLPDTIILGASMSDLKKTPEPEETLPLDCDDEVIFEPTPEPRHNLIVLDDVSSAPSSSLQTTDSPWLSSCSDSASSDISIEALIKKQVPEQKEHSTVTRKRKRPHKRKKPSALDETLSVLKSLTSEPREADVPYACGLIVQSTFRQYPQEQHSELLLRLSAFLARLQIEVKNKNKNQAD